MSPHGDIIKVARHPKSRSIGSANHMDVPNTRRFRAAPKLRLHLTSTSGNTLSDASGKTYTCDFENRLIQAVVPGQNGGTTTFK
jgi:hypothetical protein